MRSFLAFAGVVCLAVPAAAAPPRGKRSARPKPTHVVVVASELDAGLETKVKLAAGHAVVVKGKTVTTTGGVEVSGTLAADALGQRVLRDVELFSEDGKTVLGTLRAGAFVRAQGKAQGKAKASKAAVVVETVGKTRVKGQVAADALGVDGPELVLRDPAGSAMGVAAADAELYPTQEAYGKTIAYLEQGAELIALETLGKVVHVRTYGDVELEGWIFDGKLGDPASVTATAPEAPQKLTPSHEVFRDTPLYAASGDPAGKKKSVGKLRGGTLVLVSQKPKDGMALVRTSGDVHAEGWVKLADLDALESSVWNEQ